MNRYDSYKDSGVEWIGQIPSEWECIRLGMLGVFSSSGIDKKSIENETPVRMVNYTDIIQSRKYYPIQTGEKRYMRVTTPKSKFEEHKLERGDMVFIPSSETYEDLGYSSLIDFDEEDIVYSYHILRYKNRKSVYHYYKKYLINHHSVLNQFSSECKGTTRQIIGRDVFNNVRVVLPPLSEQKQIVSFLDTKTSLIDTLIEKTKQKIELLIEKRTSLINEVVTKGLNPNEEMKDSGVEWIGEIPSHYEIGKLKHLCNENQRSLSNSTDPNYELNYIEISDVNSEGVIGNYTPYVFSESPSRCRRIVQKGDVIVSTVRTYLKSIGLIEEEVDDLICSTGFSVLTPIKRINSKYLFYLLRTEWFISKVISKSEGVSYPSIQSEKLMNIDVVYCEQLEQQQIVEYLDEKTQKIDKTISIEEKRNKLLKEYRQSLISEVVTGKLKVTKDG
jgi:type I restriction enzyme S subunit